MNEVPQEVLDGDAERQRRILEARRRSAQTRRANTETRILEAAEAVVRDLARKSGTGTDVTVDDIARRAAVGRSTIYKHFSGTAEVALAVVERARANGRESELHPDIQVLAGIGAARSQGRDRQILDLMLELQRRDADVRLEEAEEFLKRAQDLHDGKCIALAAEMLAGKVQPIDWSRALQLLVLASDEHDKVEGFFAISRVWSMENCLNQALRHLPSTELMESDQNSLIHLADNVLTANQPASSMWRADTSTAAFVRRSLAPPLRERPEKTLIAAWEKAHAATLSGSSHDYWWLFRTRVMYSLSVLLLLELAGWVDADFVAERLADVESAEGLSKIEDKDTKELAALVSGYQRLVSILRAKRPDEPDVEWAIKMRERDPFPRWESYRGIGPQMVVAWYRWAKRAEVEETLSAAMDSETSPIWMSSH